MPRAAAVETTRFTRIYPGGVDQVRQARHDLARHLSACGYPRVDDAVLVLSEFATNAVTHSNSRGQHFTVKAELFPGCLLLMVEDLGGDWVLKLPDEDRPHGLNIVEILAGPDSWGVDGDERGWVVWARLGTPDAF